MKSSSPFAGPALERRPRLVGLIDGWAVVALAVAAVVALPVLVVLASLLVPSGEIWAHLASTVLRDYLWGTSAGTLGVGCGVLVTGVGRMAGQHVPVSRSPAVRVSPAAARS